MRDETEQRVVNREPPVGVWVGKVGQAVVPHALRELTHLLHKGWVPEVFVLAAGGQVAALLQRGTKVRVVLLLVAGAAKLPVGAGVVASRVLGRMRAPAEEALSRREIEVLSAVARGLSNRAIARSLHISEATVKTHLLHVCSSNSALTTERRR